MEDIAPEDFSEDRRYHFYWISEYLRWMSSKSSAVRLLSSEEFWGVFTLWGFYPLSRISSLKAKLRLTFKL